ncbi:hypothetical protein BpHYR1_033659 [Brachionus plicatilis]|uniref:Uncharacterized protein n=1 Tax=Brachionus plicatilis TaxID=10195 RepID=A0A3M7RGS5_BRAPC|nr:hypothetical protein BpHYR1_033659 [Brachionus plicatilis]
MSEVEDEVEKKKQEGILDEKLLSEAVELRLKSKGVTTNQILLNNSNIEKASDTAIGYSKKNDLKEIRENFKPNFAHYPDFGGDISYELASFSMAPTRMIEKKEIEFSVGRSDVSYAQSERLYLRNLYLIKRKLTMWIKNRVFFEIKEKINFFISNYLTCHVNKTKIKFRSIYIEFTQDVLFLRKFVISGFRYKEVRCIKEN